jgi:hypothetical protein
MNEKCDQNGQNRPCSRHSLSRIASNARAAKSPEKCGDRWPVRRALFGCLRQSLTGFIGDWRLGIQIDYVFEFDFGPVGVI